MSSLLNIIEDKKKKKINIWAGKKMIFLKTEAEKGGGRIHYESRGHHKKLRKIKNKNINKKRKHQKMLVFE